VNTRIIASIPTIAAESGSRIFSVELNGTAGYDTREQTTVSSRVGGRIEKLLIKYNYQPVKRGQLIMEIYSPDIAAAQRELLFTVNTADQVMFQKAKQRLELLGMRSAEIDKVIWTGEILYKVPVYSNSDGYILEKSTINNIPAIPVMTPGSASGDDMSVSGSSVSQSSATVANPSPVLIRQGQYVSAGQSLFTIYRSTGVVAQFALDPQIAPYVKPGQKLILYSNSNRTKMYPAKIGLIEPVYRNNQYFSIARVYLNKREFQVGQLLKANIPVVFTGGWWIPKKAIWRMGTKSIVFKKEGNSFRPSEVKTGAIIKDMVQVKTDISDWQIASNAYYLVDSESFININANNSK
jgi:biotin carboxyl carrier protein